MDLWIYYEVWLNGKQYLDEKFDTEADAMIAIDNLETTRWVKAEWQGKIIDATEPIDEVVNGRFEIKRFIQKVIQIMKKVEIWGALNLDDALKRVKAEAEKFGCVCWAEFNMKKIYSTDSIDDAYLKVCGCTKAEHDEKVRKGQEEWDRQEREHKANIPNLVEKYRKEARGLVIEEELDSWDWCVPIRLGDLYQGMELGCTLDLIRVMRDESLFWTERLDKARDMFYHQGHSGMSASLMFAMLCKFCPDGEKLIEYLRK